MIPVIQWSVYSCDGLDYITGWTSGRGIISSAITSFKEPIALTESGLEYLIHPDSQGVNFEALVLLNRWAYKNNFSDIKEVTKKYYLSDY